MIDRDRARVVGFPLCFWSGDVRLAPCFPTKLSGLGDDGRGVRRPGGGSVEGDLMGNCRLVAIVGHARMSEGRGCGGCS